LSEHPELAPRVQELFAAELQHRKADREKRRKA
jgi:hypothetical protein